MLERFSFTTRPARESDRGTMEALFGEQPPTNGDLEFESAGLEFELLATEVLQGPDGVVGALRRVLLPCVVQGKRRTFARLSKAVVSSELPRAERLRGWKALIGGVVKAENERQESLGSFGWFTPNEWRTAQREFEFQPARTETWLTRDPKPELRREPLDTGELPEVEALEAFDHQTTWVQDRVSGTWGASLVRSPELLNARLARATGEISVFGCFDHERILRGWIVVETTRDSVRALDFFVPPEEVSVGRALVARATSDAGPRAFALMLPPWSPWFDRLQDWGFLVQVGEDVLAARTKIRRHDFYWLRDSWMHQPLMTGWPRA